MQVQNIVEDVHDYHENWKKCVERIHRNILPKLALHSKPIGKQCKLSQKEMETNSCLRVDETGFVSLNSNKFKKKKKCDIVF